LKETTRGKKLYVIMVSYYQSLRTFKPRPQGLKVICTPEEDIPEVIHFVSGFNYRVPVVYHDFIHLMNRIKVSYRGAITVLKLEYVPVVKVGI
jgi:hypothetical protein